MAPRLGEGNTKKPTRKQSADRNLRAERAAEKQSVLLRPPKKPTPPGPVSAPPPKKMAPGLAAATKPVPRAAAKRMAAQDRARPKLSPAQAQALSQAKNPALARAALASTQKQQGRIIASQHPSLLNADVLGVQNVAHTIAHPSSILAGSRFDSSVKPLTFDARGRPSNAAAAGIAFPGGPGRIASKLFGRTGLNAAAEAAAVDTGGVMAPGAALAARELRRSAYKVAKDVRAGTPQPGGGFGPSLLSQQKAINKSIRGERAAEYEKRIAQGDTHEAAMAALAGDFKRVPLPSSMAPGWNDQNLQYLKDYAQRFVDDTYDKVRVKETLNKIASGETPQRAEAKLLEKTFGGEFARMNPQFTAWMHVREGFHNILNAPRELEATADLSGTFRQALLAGMRHPSLIYHNMGPQLRSLASEDYYNRFVGGIQHSDLAAEMEQAKVRITVLGKERAAREEVYQSPWLEKTPGVGRVIRASGRAYTALLDGVRKDLFEKIYKNHQAAGLFNGMSEKEYDHYLKSLGEFVNNATGQGGKMFGRHAASLNTFFWSPRLLASRINMFNPLYYAHLSPAVRKEALRAFGHFMAAQGIILGTAAVVLNKSGVRASVGLDPRSSDFGKIKVGNTRIDTLGGFQQPVVFASREITGKKMNTSTGVLQTLSPGIGHQSRWDVAESFARGKINPSFGIPVDWLHGQNTIGQPFSWTQETYSHAVPLAIQDAIGQTQWPPKPGDIAAAGAGYVGSGLGLGVQSYGKRQTSLDKKAIQDAKDSGLWDHVGGKLPQAVSEDIRARDVLDAKLNEIASGDHQYRDKLGVVIPEYVKKYPQYAAPLQSAVEKYKDNETALNKMYLALLHGSTSNNLPPLYPMLEKWTAAIHYFNERKATGG